MNCQSVDLFLMNCSLEDMALVKDTLMQRHIYGCKHCTESYRETEAYLQGVAQLSVPKLSSIDKNRLLAPWSTKKVPNTPVSSYLPGFFQGFSVACAFSLALSIGFYLQSGLTTDGLITSNATMEESKITPIKWKAVREQNLSIAIEAPSRMQQAQLSLRFPDGMRWSGLEGTDTVAWPVNLDKGVNILEVPVAYNLSMLDHDFQEITIKLRYRESSRNFQLPVVLKTHLSTRSAIQSDQSISL